MELIILYLIYVFQQFYALSAMLPSNRNGVGTYQDPSAFSIISKRQVQEIEQRTRYHLWKVARTSSETHSASSGRATFGGYYHASAVRTLLENIIFVASRRHDKFDMVSEKFLARTEAVNGVYYEWYVLMSSGQLTWEELEQMAFNARALLPSEGDELVPGFYGNVYTWYGNFFGQGFHPAPGPGGTELVGHFALVALPTGHNL